MKDQQSIFQVQAKENKNESSEGSDVGNFALDPLGEAQQHIMNILTNMYSDPHRATVQETLSNAYDSHKRAGNKVDPVKVYITTESGYVLTSKEVDELISKSAQFASTRLSFSHRPTGTVVLDSGLTIKKDDRLYLVVQDYGTGMSRKELETRFFRYGASDKRGSSVERGGFGLGCKAGLSLLGEIKVSSVKDSIRTDAVGYLNSEVNRVDYTDMGATDEPNGTRIETPFQASNIKKIVSSIKSPHLRIFWDETPLEINGEKWDGKESLILNAAKNNWHQIKAESGTVWFSTETAMASSYYSRASLYSIAVNLGGVAYNVDMKEEAISNTLKELGFSNGLTYNLAFDVPLTSLVALTPSRESILYDDNTLSNLVAMIKDKISMVDSYVRTTVNSFDNPRSAALWIIKNQGVLVKQSGYNVRENSATAIYSRIPWRGENIFTRPEYQNFVCYVASSRTIKSSKFTVEEDWKQTLNTAQHATIISRFPTIVNTRTILVSAPNRFMHDRKTLQKISMACRSVASYAAQSDFFSKAEHKFAQTESVVFHFSYLDVETLKNNANIVSNYAKVVSWEELIAEGDKLRESNKVVKPKIDTASVPRHIVISAQDTSEPKIVSDNFLKDKEVTIITREVVTKDQAATFVSAVTRYEKNSIETNTKTVYNIARKSMVSRLKEYAELYPDSYFLILPPTRKASPIYRAIPHAKHLWVRLIDELDMNDVDLQERSLMLNKWGKEVETIRSVAKAYSYRNASKIVDSLTESLKDQTSRQTKVMSALYSSVNEYDSKVEELVDAVKEENMSKFLIESEHFELKVQNKEKLNLILLLTIMKMNQFGASYGFKPSSRFRFFEVMRIAHHSAVPSKNSSAGLAVSIINSMSE